MASCISWHTVLLLLTQRNRKPRPCQQPPPPPHSHPHPRHWQPGIHSPVSGDLPVLDVFHQWNHTLCDSFCVWLLSLSIEFSSSSMYVNASVLFMLNNIPICGHAMISLSIICCWICGLFPLFDYCELCCCKHPRTSSYVDVCFFLLSRNLRLELQGHMVTQC